MMLDIKKVVYQIREDKGHYFDAFIGTWGLKSQAVSAMRKLKRKHPNYKYKLEKWNPKLGRWISGGVKL
jgi:hypothetical protein